MALDIPQHSPQRPHGPPLHAPSFSPLSRLGRSRARTPESSQPQNDLVKGSTTGPQWSQSEMGLGWKLGPKMLDLGGLVVIQAHLAVAFWILPDHILTPSQPEWCLRLWMCSGFSLSPTAYARSPRTQSGSAVGKVPASFWDLVSLRL